MGAVRKGIVWMGAVVATDRLLGLLLHLLSVDGPVRPPVHAGAFIAGGIGIALAVAWALLTRRREGRNSAGAWLVAGALLAALIDRLWAGGAFVHPALFGGSLPPFGFSDVVLLAGLVLLAAELVGMARAPRLPLLALTAPPLSFPEFSEFRRGIDNVRVDVHLSPQLCRRARTLVASVLRHEMRRDRHGERWSSPTRQEFNAFRDGYGDVLTAAIHAAKHDGAPQRVALLQIALLKFLDQSVGHEFDTQIGQLRGSLQSSHEKRSATKLALYDQIYQLALRRHAIEQNARKQLFEQVKAAELSRGSDLGSALFGQRWALPREMLFNPLLQSDDAQDSALLMRHYVLVGKRAEDWRSLSKFERQVEAVVSTALPATAEELVADHDTAGFTDPDWTACAENLGLDPMRGEVLWRLWSGVPENIDRLFNPRWLRDRIAAAGEAGQGEELQRLRTHRRFQEGALARLVGFCEAEGLLARIIAAYEMVPVYAAGFEDLNPQLVYQAVSGGRGQRNAWRQLRKAREAEGGAALRPLRRLARRVRQLAQRRERTAYLLRFLKDFFVYRRDQRYYCLVRAAMGQIRLLEAAEDVRLSRANGCLHEFLSSEETAPTDAQVCAHAVIKADLRGSTTITRELVERGLNPATHFERNFFAPINEILHAFGAQKVFVEGDAVIAVVQEYADDIATQLAVARACGVARKILNVVRLHNAASSRDGLPELQVGIGIAYKAGSPAYLFEGEQPIMISPAIGRADRLSSSSWRLESYGVGDDEGAVRVYELEPGHPLRGEKGEIDLRYNVNGVELEAEGFAKLGEEIALREVALAGRGDYFVGRYPDVNGVMHLVALRAHRVRLLGKEGPSGITERRFYEVIAEPRLLAAIEAVARDEGAAAAGRP